MVVVCNVRREGDVTWSWSRTRKWRAPLPPLRGGGKLPSLAQRMRKLRWAHETWMPEASKNRRGLTGRTTGLRLCGLRRQRRAPNGVSLAFGTNANAAIFIPQGSILLACNQRHWSTWVLDSSCQVGLEVLQYRHHHITTHSEPSPAGSQTGL